MSTLKANAFQDTSGRGFYPARLWVQYSSTVGTVVLQNDEGVSSVTDNGNGNQTTNFSITLSSNKYGLSGSAGGALPGYGSRCLLPNAMNTTSAQVYMQWHGNSTYYDSNHNAVIIHGDM